MDIAHFTTSLLSEALELVEKRQALESQLAKVNSQLGAIQVDGISTSKVKPAKPVVAKSEKPKAVKSAKVESSEPLQVAKGKLKDRLVPILKAAGSGGIAVTDLAAALQMGASNLHVWFSTTGKKDASIQKVGRGRYAWKDVSEEEKPVRETFLPPDTEIPEPIAEDKAPVETAVASESIESNAAEEPQTDLGEHVEPTLESHVPEETSTSETPFVTDLVEQQELLSSDDGEKVLERQV